MNAILQASAAWAIEIGMVKSQPSELSHGKILHSDDFADFV
jgi:hypothetical protein